jgi:peptide/nickel transport system substrate-binding protein
MLVTACGGSSGGTSSSGPTKSNTGSGNGAYVKLATNATGTPATGGTLNILGTSDTDYLDQNITYYSLGYAFVRLFDRQLYTYPAVLGKQTSIVPDIATAAPSVSADGKTVTVTIKQGVMWNTSPARQVTAADAVRGLETTCNPAQPFGGLPDFEGFIVGMTKYCAGFAKQKATASAIKAYEANTPFPGATANGETITYHLTQPVAFFPNLLALPAFSPRAIEQMNYVPASAQEAQHTVADGPYEVSTYNPAHSITFVRNPAWNRSTDSVRHAYVNKIIVTMTNDPVQAQQQLQTGIATADLDDGSVPATDVPALIASNDPNLDIESEIATNPYLLFNTQSPNNGGALSKVAVRQALEFALNRSNIIQDLDGPKLNPPLTHVLPPQINGSQNFDLYPHNVAKAKQLLASAGVKHLTLKYLYRPSSPTETKIFQTVQADLKVIGVTVKALGVPDADFYTKYLEVPSTARRGVWDLAAAGWLPDWYGEAALSFFGPLFDGRVLPPSSSNFGLFNDPKVNKMIDQAKAAKSASAADAIWAQADRQVMEDAAFFPITDPNGATYHASQVHNYIYLPATSEADWTNVWLDPSKNGG